MPAVNDLSDLIVKLQNDNESVFFHKVPRINGVTATTPVAGRGTSLWTYDGMPGSGDVPGGNLIPTDLTVGSIPNQDYGFSHEKRLISAHISPLTPGTYLLYDRLFMSGGHSGTLTTPQIVQGSPATPALSRNIEPDFFGYWGVGNIAFYEIYTAIGTTSATLNVDYTSHMGLPAFTSINIGGTGFREATRMQRIPLESGENTAGIQSIQRIQLSASTGTAGNFGITIARPLAWLPVGAASTPGWRDFTTGLPGLPKIDNDACLALMFIPSVATAPEVWGCLNMVIGPI